LCRQAVKTSKGGNVNAVTWPDPATSILDDQKWGLLRELVKGLSPAQLYAVAAYSASLAEQKPGTAPNLTAVAPSGKPAITVLYGSQTGNARRIAEQLVRRFEGGGLHARLVRADTYPQRELAQERHLFVVISTQGDGDPPDDARGLFEFLFSKRAPQLPQLSFAVLGLGDSSYPQFCTIGRQLDARLAELGGRRLVAAGEADLDIETVADPWLGSVVGVTRESLGAAQGPVAVRAVPGALPAHSRDTPFVANILANQRIVARGSEREVRHIEVSLTGSGMRYAPGDSLGIWPVHSSTQVAQWLETLGLAGDSVATRAGRSLPLSQWLSTELELTRPGRPFVAALAEGNDTLTQLLKPGHGAALSTLLREYRPIDLLRRHRPSWNAQQLVDALRPQSPRLYSIASSPMAVGDDEAHLTVTVVDHPAHGTQHRGAATGYLADGGEDVQPRVFIEPNERFRLPAARERDIIMIGPGTGVAPFRAFVQERRETAATGRNWLFFGNRHFQRDFLYQTEWQAELKRGTLHRLDLAFSRDQAEKIYVQHRLREQGHDIYAWLSEGAHLYVCGDAEAMAKDVHAALIDIAVVHGGHSRDHAQVWLDELLQQGRYARDVY
jgi:sulfite reductase (NADPH) flavoprotein alpha-component